MKTFFDMTGFVALLLLAAICSADARPHMSSVRRFPGFGRSATVHKRSQSTPPPDVEMYTQILDHFNQEATQATFSQRVLKYDGYWGKTSTKWSFNGCPGPIFFYTGNESPVTDYYYNSGFMFELAQRHGARIIFVEHRYFGESMPFGNESFAPENVGYLSPEQALADYATYVSAINTGNCPVVAFGGSYGGMLTAWARMKYPNIFIGGLAASAPFGFYGTGLSPYAYMDAAQRSYAEAGPNCDGKLGTAIQAILSASQSSAGLAQLSSAFPTCAPLNNTSDGVNLLNWVQNALVYMVELDYDTASNYGIQFPAWPVNRTCTDLLQAWSQGPIAAIAYAIQNYYNSTGNRRCVDIIRDQPDFAFSPGWDYIACTEAYMPMAQRGMWWPTTTPNLPADSQACQQEWGIPLRPDWSRIHWGGFSSFSSGSNIIFSNGLIDPWHALGVLSSPNVQTGVVSIVIPESAHHGDLRGSHPNDPVYLQEARVQEEKIIVGWLSAFLERVHDS